MRTVAWGDNVVQLIDQRLLPAQLVILALTDVGQVASAIRDMAVRGAPAIGATAAYGLALAAATSRADTVPDLLADLREAADVLRAARPTAVNLGWAIDRVLAAVNEPAAGDGAANAAHDPAALGPADHESAEHDSAAHDPTALDRAALVPADHDPTDHDPAALDPDTVRARILAEAECIADEDVATNRRMGAHGAELLRDGATVIHHCNTGALATVDFGTALGVIRAAHEAGKRVHVLVDETRPRLQGARLTTWELGQLGVPHTLIVDGAAGHFLQRGGVDAVLVGADRIAANGDTANKIGTYPLAVVAHANNVPFYVVAPTTTIDLATPTGDDIPIELRAADEVTTLDGAPVAPPGTNAANPAFDVTPHRYISAIVTEVGVLRPPFAATLDAAARARQPRRAAPEETHEQAQPAVS